jgi:hypothetical protein
MGDAEGTGAAVAPGGVLDALGADAAAFAEADGAAAAALAAALGEDEPVALSETPPAAAGLPALAESAGAAAEAAAFGPVA